VHLYDYLTAGVDDKDNQDKQEKNSNEEDASVIAKV
jgi:hypothetical protein